VGCVLYRDGVRRFALLPAALIVACVGVVSCLPSEAVAAGKATETKPATAGAPSAAQATDVKELYDQGTARYETFDYAGAIAAWTQVYAMLGASEEERRFKASVLYSLGLAHEFAYGQDHDLRHLHQSVQLLQKHLAEMRALYPESPEGASHLAEVEARVAAIEQRIAATATASVPQPTAVRVPVAPRKPTARDVLRRDPELGAQYRRGRNLITAGAVTMGVGGVIAITTLSLFVQDRFGLYRSYEIAMGTIAGAAVVTGAVLLGIGVPMKRAALRTAESRLTLLPVVGPQWTGISASAHF